MSEEIWATLFCFTTGIVLITMSLKYPNPDSAYSFYGLPVGILAVLISITCWILMLKDFFV
jgi:hypothetical protein